MTVQTTMPTTTPVIDNDQPTQTPTPQLYARFAGVLYLVITVAAVFAHFYMPGELIVPGDAAATTANIAAAPNLFWRAGIGGELVVLLSEVVLAILLYVLLKPVNRTLSLLAAVSRLVMTAVHIVNLLNYAFVLVLVSSPAYAAAFSPEQVQALVALFLEAHSIGFTLGIAFLVIHVFSLGVLIYQSGYFPRLIGVLFLLAGVGYLVDTVALLFVGGYTETPGLIAMVIAAAEIAFPTWLLTFGVNRARWQQATR